MKPNRFLTLWVLMLVATLTMLFPQSICAAGASSNEINATIVLDGSIPLTWENDATYPWIIEDGKMKSGNAGVKDSSSSLKFKYSSTCVTNISFNYQNNDYNSSTHSVEVLVDGVVKYNSNSSKSVKSIQLRLPIGNHSIEIRNAIGNSSSANYYALLWNVCVTETFPADSATLNNSIVLDGSTNLTWYNDTKYPWTIENGYAKSGNFGLRNTKSELKFTYTTTSTSQLTFKYQNNDYNSSEHLVWIYIDGELKYESNNSQSVKSVDLFFPKGKHEVALVDSIINSDSYNYYMKVWDIKAYPFDNLESSILNTNSLPLKLNDVGSQPWYIENGCAKSSNYRYANSNSIIESEISIDQTSVLSFNTKSGYNGTDHKFRFYINDDCYYTSENSNWNYVSVVLQPGKYKLTWKDENQYSGSNYYSLIQDVYLRQNCVEVSITPGMLGVEVLYKVNVLTDVELLKIKGTLNEADWNAIKMMTNLKSLDLSETSFPEIADKQFSSLPYLNTIKLPNTVKRIGEEAFVGTNIHYLIIPSSVEQICKYAFQRTPLTTIDFAPNSNLTNIGYSAFYECTRLKEFIMPNSVKSLDTYSSGYNDSYTFYRCRALTRLIFSDALTNLPECTCYENSAIEEMHFPSNLVSIGNSFMYGANNLKELNLPETLRSIGSNAFAGLHQVEHLVLPEKINYIGSGAFHNSARLQIVELPSGVSSYDQTFNGCSNIEKVVCRAATPPSISSDAFNSITKANVTLEVPAFAVAAYKLDPYWYQFGNILEGEPTDYCRIIGDLKLLNNRRMEGKPDIDLYYNGKLTVGGDAPMTIGKFDIYTSDVNASSFVTDCANVTADEINTIYHVDANKWYFITPMVDIDLRQVNVTGTSNYVFRYYDGATRADIGAGTSWKNVSDMTLKSGVGYIFQCNAASDVIFPVPVSMNSKVLTTEAVTLPLVAHPSDNVANKGWNYVGNPFPSYFDIYYMDFTAPITVWTGSTYKAYSITDDDFVLRPMQGFFVQKPDAVDNIVLQPAGRQVESSVNRAYKAPAYSRAAGDERAFFNLAISGNDYSDETRIVLNETASVKYEIERDASKFMSIDQAVPQLYTLDSEGNRLAINERPAESGEIALGVFIPSSEHAYSISASRIDGQAFLYDAITGIKHDLSVGEYNFTSENGSFDNRFSVILKSGVSSSIENLIEDSNVVVSSSANNISVQSAENKSVQVVGLDGSIIYENMCAMPNLNISVSAGLYIVVVSDKSYKIAVK